MKDIENLLQKLPNDVFTLQEASIAGVSRYYLSKMIESQVCRQSKHNYCNSQIKHLPEDDFHHKASSHLGSKTNKEKPEKTGRHRTRREKPFISWELICNAAQENNSI